MDFRKFFGIFLLLLISKSKVTCGRIESPPFTEPSVQYIVESIDWDVDPCTDFYNFACGRWSVQHPKPADKTNLDNFEILGDGIVDTLKSLLESNNGSTTLPPIVKARKMYSTCLLNGDSSEYLREDLENMLNWPILRTENSWDENKFDFIKAFGDLSQILSSIGLVDMGVGPDDKNSSVYIIQLGLPSGDSDGIQKEFEKLNSRMIVTEYRNFLSGTSFTLGAVDNATVAEDVDKIIKLEGQVLKLKSNSGDDMFNVTAKYNRIPIRELQSMAGKFFDWLPLIRSIFRDNRINDDTEVILTTPRYVVELDSLLNATSKRTISNFMGWEYIKKMGEFVGGNVTNLSKTLENAVLGINQSEPRWRTCVKFVNKKMGFVTGRLFIEKTSNDKIKADTEEMIELIRSAFIENLKNATWMDEQTRQKAIEKAKSMQKFVGYPDWILNDTILSNFYSEYIVGDSHYNNAKNSDKALIQFQFSKWDKEATEDIWVKSMVAPSDVDAQYLFQGNAISLSSAILQSPFFTPNSLSAINFGAIGSVIGHEITHGFDDTGRQYDEDGNLNNWWKDSTMLAFDNAAECYRAQYDNYCPLELAEENITDHCVKGNETLGENIADNGGIKSAYAAYQMWINRHGDEKRKVLGLEGFTNWQIFFLSFANIWCEVNSKEALSLQVGFDQHSPKIYRVNGVLSNFEAFIDSFECRGKPMDRVNKCLLW